MRGVEHLRAQPPKKRVQGMRGVEHLRAQPHTKQLQALRAIIRGIEHLRAQPHTKQLQAVRRRVGYPNRERNLRKQCQSKKQEQEDLLQDLASCEGRTDLKISQHI
jgi:hypothetical protein